MDILANWTKRKFQTFWHGHAEAVGINEKIFFLKETVNFEFL